MIITAEDILADITEEKTIIGGIGDLIDGLKKQLADALSGVTVPPATQSKLDAIFAGVEANKVAAALIANTAATQVNGLK